MDGDASTPAASSPFKYPASLPRSAASTPAPSAPPTPYVPPSPLKDDVKPKLEPGEGHDGLADEHDEPESQPIEAGPSVRRKRRLEAAHYTPAEVAEIEARAAAIDFAVALDQHETLYARQTNFASFEDAVDRLLPWHIWQVPEEELDLPSEERAQADLSTAGEQVADLIDLRRRFAKARRREGHHPSDLPSLIYMLRESTAEMREELAAVQATFKIAKGKHDAQLAEERRVREAAAAKERMRQEEVERQRRAQFVAQAQEQARQQAALAAARPPPAVPATAPTVPSAVPGGPAAAPVRPPAPSGPPLVASIAIPFAGPSTPAAVAPGTPVGASVAPGMSTPTAPVRGRPRGRPRGSGRGGMRQPATPHARPPPAKKTTSPVQITVAMSLIPAFVAAALLILPNPQNLKAPATIIRTSDDKKNVTLSIDLGACTQPQLQTLARLLNVQAKLPNASGSSTPNGNSSPAPAPGPSAPAAAPASASAAPAPTPAPTSTPTAPPPPQ